MPRQLTDVRVDLTYGSKVIKSSSWRGGVAASSSLIAGAEAKGSHLELKQETHRADLNWLASLNSQNSPQ